MFDFGNCSITTFSLTSFFRSHGVLTVSCPSFGAFGIHLDVGLAKRSTLCRFVATLTFPSLFLGKDGRL